MWVIASVCPTIGSQLGQIPCIFSHFCSIRPTHGKKERILEFFQDHYSYFYQIYRQYGHNRDVYGSFKTIQIPFKTIVNICIISTFWLQIHPNQAKQVQTYPNSNFQISLCLLCLLCTHVSKFGRVLKTHSHCDNSHNRVGRQLQFTSEVTLIGTHIVSKFQPNPTIIAKVIHHFVHSSFFQDHLHPIPLCGKLH